MRSLSLLRSRIHRISTPLLNSFSIPRMYATARGSKDTIAQMEEEEDTANEHFFVKMFMEHDQLKFNGAHLPSEYIFLPTPQFNKNAVVGKIELEPLQEYLQKCDLAIPELVHRLDSLESIFNKKKLSEEAFETELASIEIPQEKKLKWRKQGKTEDEMRRQIYEEKHLKYEEQNAKIGKLKLFEFPMLKLEHIDDVDLQKKNYIKALVEFIITLQGYGFLQHARKYGKIVMDKIQQHTADPYYHLTTYLTNFYCDVQCGNSLYDGKSQSEITKIFLEIDKFVTAIRRRPQLSPDLKFDREKHVIQLQLQTLQLILSVSIEQGQMKSTIELLDSFLENKLIIHPMILLYKAALVAIVNRSEESVFDDVKNLVDEAQKEIPKVRPVYYKDFELWLQMLRLQYMMKEYAVEKTYEQIVNQVMQTCTTVEFQGTYNNRKNDHLHDLMYMTTEHLIKKSKLMDALRFNNLQIRSNEYNGYLSEEVPLLLVQKAEIMYLASGVKARDAILDIYQHALQLNKLQKGEMNPDMALIYHSMAQLYKKIGMNDESQQYSALSQKVMDHFQMVNFKKYNLFQEIFYNSNIKF